MTRKLNVQTPGEAPANTGDTQDDTVDQGVQTPGEVLGASSTGPTVEELQAQLAALQDENARLAAENAAKKAAADPEENRKSAAKADAEFESASRSISRASREKFLHMHARQVNPKELVAAVLTKDGWVAPDQSGQKGKE